MSPDQLPELSDLQAFVVGEGADSRAKVSGWGHFPELAPWIVRFEAEPVAGRLVLTGLAIAFDPVAATNGTPIPALGIGSDLLKRLRTGDLLSAIHREVTGLAASAQFLDMRAQLATGEPIDSSALHADLRAALPELSDAATPRKRGRKPHAPEYLRRVAEVRLEIQAEGVRPIDAAVADRLGLSGPTAAKDLVNRAARAGWLAKGTPGRSHRTPGPLLLAAWEREATDASTDTNEGEHDR